MSEQAGLLILDEPTAHLDAETASAVAGALRRLVSGRTTLLISHDRASCAIAHRIVALDRGRVCKPLDSGSRLVEVGGGS